MDVELVALQAMPFLSTRMVILSVGDPRDTMLSVTAADPKKDELLEVMAAWQAALGDRKVQVAVIDEEASFDHNAGRTDQKMVALRNKLIEVTSMNGKTAWSARSVGWWLRRHKDRVVGGRCFRNTSDARGGHQEWQVHGPLAVEDHFDDSSVPYRCDPSLNLDTEIRQHQATGVHEFVAKLLSANPAIENRRLAMKLDSLAYHLRIARELGIATEYLRTRYCEDRQARFGLVASSKDRDLVRFGIDNDYRSTKRVRFRSFSGSVWRRIDECPDWLSGGW
jgi:hypothetical protein